MKLQAVEADWPWRAFLTCRPPGKLFTGVPPLFTSMRLAWAHSHGNLKVPCSAREDKLQLLCLCHDYSCPRQTDVAKSDSRDGEMDSIS